MQSVRGRDTKPEMLIRSGLHARGLRYRLHHRGLPGKPDLVFPKHRALILVHGCFWHGHACPLFKWPKTRQEFWHEKIEGNRTRDRRTIEALHQAGWRILIVWECSMRGPKRLVLQDLLNEAEHFVAQSERTFRSLAGSEATGGSSEKSSRFSINARPESICSEKVRKNGTN
ncbi:very short patch repair endonuclease [Jannaschia sp. S6380]|nr:very short patch repair endonuclease [Jannaschia sp. S6380]